MRPRESPIDHVLPGNSDARRQRQHVIDAARALEVEQAEVGRLGSRREPRGLQAFAAGHVVGIVLAVEHHAGADVAIDDFDGVPPFTAMRLAAHADSRRSRTCPSARRRNRRSCW